MKQEINNQSLYPVTKKQSLNQVNTFFKKIKTSLKKRDVDMPIVKLDIVYLILSKLEESFLTDTKYSIPQISEAYEIAMEQECPCCERKVKDNLNHFCLSKHNEILFR